MENTNLSTDPNQSSQNINQQFNNQFGQQPPIPNSTAVLVLGICSIFPGCFCAGIVGIVCGIIALVLAKKAKLAYEANPSGYTMSSFNNLKAGRVCGIIGLCLSSVILLFYIVYIVIIGAAVSMMPWQGLH